MIFPFTMKSLIFCVVFIVNFFRADASWAEMGPMGEVNFRELLKCESNGEGFLKMEASIKQAPDGSKCITAKFNIPEDVPADDLFLSVQADELVNNDWKKDKYTLDDKPFLLFMNEHFSIIFNKFKNAVANLLDGTTFKAGDYSIDCFPVSTPEIGTPQVFYGRFLASFSLFIGDRQLDCVRADFEFLPPSAGKME